MRKTAGERQPEYMQKPTTTTIKKKEKNMKNRKKQRIEHCKNDDSYTDWREMRMKQFSIQIGKCLSSLFHCCNHSLFEFTKWMQKRYDRNSVVFFFILCSLSLSLPNRYTSRVWCEREKEKKREQIWKEKVKKKWKTNTRSMFLFTSLETF